MQLESYIIKKVVMEALKEDIAEGDITTDILLSQENSPHKAKILAKSSGVLAGIEIAKEVFYCLHPRTKITTQLKDGDTFNKEDIVLEFETFPSTILKGERVALNFLQKLSGIASLTRKFVDLVSPYGVKILDTRKTTPNLRLLEKYAVRVGGGANHRLNLNSAILIKENHIKLVGGASKAIKLIKQSAPIFSKIEVEIETRIIDELEAIIDLQVDVVMLDNFDYQQLKKAIEVIRKKSPQTGIEVSGGIKLSNLEAIAQLKPDFISIGAITHSAPAIDMNLDIV